MAGGHAWQGGMHVGGHVVGGHAWQGGVWWGHAWQGVCMAGGDCMVGGVRGRYYEIRSMSGR